MKIIDHPSKKVEDLSISGNSEEIIDSITYELKKIKKENSAELYLLRGNAWYDKNNYNNAIDDYNKAIKINKNYTLAFYNRGFAKIKKGEYDSAIEDYSKVVTIDESYVGAYVVRGSIYKFKEKSPLALEDYNKAISIDTYFANAYYNRGILKKDSKTSTDSKINLEEAKQDFQKYLELTAGENDNWAKYAEYYIEDINERIAEINELKNDNELSNIENLISKIKTELIVTEDCITHYTSLSALRSLILGHSKFRMSEGNFMNDPSEGKGFFKFLGYDLYAFRTDDFLSENFSPKPFIASFVAKDKYDYLNMWRFYGKENGVEAKGCAITLPKKELVESIDNSLPEEFADIVRRKSDMNFYSVAYIDPITNTFNIPDSTNSDKLTELMNELKSKVTSYKNGNKASLEKRLKSISFLFKSNIYKSEHEVRLVVNGVEFIKKIDMDIVPPRVYIELAPIKKIVKQITLGPKVDKANEWASAFHYSYEVNPPEIIISHLPYQ